MRVRVRARVAGDIDHAFGSGIPGVRLRLRLRVGVRLRERGA